MQPDEELEEEPQLRERPAPPTFQVTALPTEDELNILGIELLIPELLELDLDDVRECLGLKRLQRTRTRTERRASTLRDGLVSAEVGITSELGDDVEDGDLMFTIGLDLFLLGLKETDLSMIVVVKPGDFDRTVQQQEALYQKCFGLVEVLSQRTVNLSQSASCGTFSFPCWQVPETGAKLFHQLFKRWEEAQ